MKKVYEGFVMNLDTAMEFYQLCKDKGAETLEERTSLIRVFVKDKKAQYLRDVEEAIKGKNIIRIQRKKK